MVAGAIEKNLRLVLKPAKRARMNDARTVALKFSPIRMAWLGIFAPARLARFLRIRREHHVLRRFHLLPFLPTVLHWSWSDDLRVVPNIWDGTEPVPPVLRPIID